MRYLLLFVLLLAGPIFAANDSCFVIPDSADAGPPAVFSSLEAALERPVTIADGDTLFVIIPEVAGHPWSSHDVGAVIVHDDMTIADGGKVYVVARGASRFAGIINATNTYVYSSASTPTLDLEDEILFDGIQFTNTKTGGVNVNIYNSSGIGSDDTAQFINCGIWGAEDYGYYSPYNLASTIIFENCIFARNGLNGAYQITASEILIMDHCIFTKNGARGFRADAGTITLRNSWAAYNVTEDIDSNGGTWTVSYIATGDASGNKGCTGCTYNQTFSFTDTTDAVNNWHWANGDSHHDAPRLATVLLDIDDYSRPATNTGRGFDHWVEGEEAADISHVRRIKEGEGK